MKYTNSVSSVLNTCGSFRQSPSTQECFGEICADMPSNGDVAYGCAASMN
ncbi:MAG: hypothetical protein NC099_01655 [Corallococcus sp.]|nr:hypothetical protein [Bacillota bacterium]MCM1533338.1 hypothetical protein [Corallococcus sp.]